MNIPHQAWRIADYIDRDSTPNDINPNLAGYNPFMSEDVPEALDGYIQFEKAEIPDIHYDGSFGLDELNEKAFPKVLFDSKEAGGVRIYLLGEYVRTDKSENENAVYSYRLSLGTVNNGAMVTYPLPAELEGVSQGGYILNKNAVSDSLCVYEMDCPLAVIRYASSDGAGLSAFYAFKDGSLYMLMGDSSAVGGEAVGVCVPVISQNVTVSGNTIKDDASGITYSFNFDNILPDDYVEAHFTASANAAEPAAPVDNVTALLSDDEMNSILNEYLRFYRYTNIGSVKVDWQNADGVVTKDGIDYCPSIEEGLTTWQEWSDFLHSIFTEDLADTYLTHYSEETKQYINVDGRLYAKDNPVGVHYGNPVQAGSRALGSGAEIEYWQEALFEGEAGNYLITVLTVESTDDGWRINGSERHMYPSDKEYVPMLDNPLIAGELTETEMNRLIDDYMRYERYFIYDSVDTAGDDRPKVGSYRPSVEEGLTTWQEWLDYIYGLLTDEAAEKCLKNYTGEGNHYINVDGYLYALDGGMGWYYGSPVQAAYKTNGSEGIIEFWREDFSEGCEWCYYITVLQIRLTDSGWRVQSADSYNADLFEEGVRDYEPLLDKPYSIDKSSYAVNKIYRRLMYDYQEAVDILTYSATEDTYVVNGVDQIGNLREIDGETYMPMVAY